MVNMRDVNKIPQEDLNKTLLGLDNYLFLINDSNRELDQHYNPDYENHFDAKAFKDNYHFKKDLLSKYNIDYHFFVVPDKSVVCRDLLPFEHDFLKRNIDEVDEIIDFTDYLTKEDYFKSDSHISYEGGRKLSYKIMNYLDNDFTLDQYNELLDNADKVDKNRFYDLLVDMNWSYSQEFKKEFSTEDTYVIPRAKDLKLIKNAPKPFQAFGSRKSVYYKNKNSVSDLRVLLFGDSSFKLFQPYLPFYFNEFFFYWDHGSFNANLIRWYQPDLIIELRTERFIDKLPSPTWIKNKQVINLSKERYMKKLINRNQELKDELEEIKSSKIYKLFSRFI